jgi:hypothetical protein
MLPAIMKSSARPAAALCLLLGMPLLAPQQAPARRAEVHVHNTISSARPDV